MKKIFMIFALCAAVATANAQVTVSGSKFLDNWSLGIDGGVETPMSHYKFIKSMRPIVGLTLAKQITPIFGLGIEGRASFNTSELYGDKSYNVVDGQRISLLGLVNLNNLFSGYKGTPRFFEIVALYGLGWGHAYQNGASDKNWLASNAGLSFNFNIGEAKAWQINLKPVVSWNLVGDGTNVSHPVYDVHRAAFQLLAGVTYKFRNSNGTHNFTLAKLYDQAEIDGLNAKINDLRSEVGNKTSELNSKDQQIKTLQDQLNECQNKAPQVVKETKTNNELESVVTFAQGKYIIDRSQLPNVERIATYLSNHSNASVVIKGYASPEGSAAINEKLAKQRAEAVKKILTSKYRIAASRIEASGQGVGDMFSEPDWNRVSISTIQK